MTFLERIELELSDAKMRTPVLVASTRCEKLSGQVENMLSEVETASREKMNLMGRDVVLVHSGEQGWEEALELICRQSPGRLFVVAPVLPRVEALKLEWVADHVVVGDEIFEYEVHELGLSA